MQTAVQQPQSGNLAIYNQVRSVPEDAKSPISGGPMKGKTNVNPMWRIQKLTELFGPCGEGWKVEQVSRWTESTGQGEVAVFCEVNLYVKVGGAWSAPIFGQGGNMLMRRSTEWVNGQPLSAVHIDDEAYKKAYTDAISVACKALGFAADVYYKEDETKYGAFRQETAAPQPGSQPAPQSVQAWPWTQGFKEITPGAPNWKASVTQVSKMSGLSPEEILGRITAKFNITRENFEALLKVGGLIAA